MSLKKLLSCLAFGLLLTAPAAEAADVLELTFRRTGTAASSVTTTATGIDGVTATLKSASHQFKNSTASVTPTILCPDVNGNSSPTITLEFELTGLPSSFTVEDLNFDIHALNSGGAYQQSDDNKSRQFNVTAQFNGTTFGSLDDIDIAKNVNTSGAERHQVWTIQADEPATPSSPLTLKVTITKGTSNEGCFFGLSSIRFNTPEPEVRPFEPAAAIGQASSFYYIQSPDNQVLDNNMQWIAKRPDPAAKWYFVGTSNADGGYQIVEAENDTPINGGAKYVVTRGETQGLYSFVDTENNPISLGGATEFLFSNFRSRIDVAVASELYTFPCGNLGSIYVTSATVSSIQGFADLHYPMATSDGTAITYPQAAKPTERYTMLSRDHATVTPGDFNVAISLSKAPTDGLRTFLYFDWDRDGYFEASQEITGEQDMNATITVPNDAVLGESRMRIRLTDNGLIEADDDVNGQVIDLFINVVDASGAQIAPTVKPNAENRGTATYDEATNMASATALGTSTFLYWQEKTRVHSLEASCEIAPACTPRTFVAVFSPNLEELSAIDRVTIDTPDNSASINVDGRIINVNAATDVRLILIFGLDGSLKLSGNGCNTLDASTMPSGIYIVKAITATGSATSKVTLH